VADLVALDSDPFAGPQEICAARVRSTWIDGECVYEA
jgi:predicted amidohydrolase YtcJ